MPNYTSILGLEKPYGSDPVSITPFNNNADILDEAIGEIKSTVERIAPIVDDISTSGGQIGDVLFTVRKDVGDKYLLCNGDVLDQSLYPDLASVHPYQALPYKLPTSSSSVYLSQNIPSKPNLLNYRNVIYNRNDGSVTTVTVPDDSAYLYGITWNEHEWVACGRAKSSSTFEVYFYTSNDLSTWTKVATASFATNNGNYMPEDGPGTALTSFMYDGICYRLCAKGRAYSNGYMYTFSNTFIEDTSNRANAYIVAYLDGIVVVKQTISSNAIQWCNPGSTVRNSTSGSIYGFPRFKVADHLYLCMLTSSSTSEQPGLEYFDTSEKKLYVVNGYSIYLNRSSTSSGYVHNGTWVDYNSMKIYVIISDKMFSIPIGSPRSDYLSYSKYTDEGNAANNSNIPVTIYNGSTLYTKYYAYCTMEDGGYSHISTYTIGGSSISGLYDASAKRIPMYSGLPTGIYAYIKAKR